MGIVPDREQAQWHKRKVLTYRWAHSVSSALFSVKLMEVVVQNIWRTMHCVFMVDRTQHQATLRYGVVMERGQWLLQVQVRNRTTGVGGVTATILGRNTHTE